MSSKFIMGFAAGVYIGTKYNHALMPLVNSLEIKINEFTKDLNNQIESARKSQLQSTSAKRLEP